MKAFFAKHVGAISGVIIAVVLFSVIVISYSLYVRQPDKPNKNESLISSLQKAASENKENPETVDIPIKNLSFEDKLVIKLKKLYGDTIYEKNTQIKLLKIKQNLIKKVPGNGLNIFYSVIKRAFPELAEEIIKTITAMEAYLAWEKENQHLIAEMNSYEKQLFLWQKREELFGADAEEIWTEEIEARDKRKQDMRNLISKLNKSKDTTIFEKLDNYQRTLDDVYSGTSEAYILKSKDLLAKIFISLDSVQAELKGMTPDERRTELYNIRREMGYSQSQIEALEKIDEKKNSRWENGLAYMDEREKLTQEFEGEELSTALASLREKYFKHAAKTIQIEEEEGFFRYNRKRIYGKN